MDRALFPYPWSISQRAWNADSSEFSFVYNQRGHQVMRLVGVRVDSGSARTVFEDVSCPFIDYPQKFIEALPGAGRTRSEMSYYYSNSTDMRTPETPVTEYLDCKGEAKFPMYFDYKKHENNP